MQSLHETPITETPLAYRAVRGGLWVAVSSYFNIAFGFLAVLALTRILSPEHFGVISLATFFFSLLNVRTKIGAEQAFVQSKETNGELVGSLLVLDVASGLATLLLAGVAVPVLRALGYAWDVIWVLLALAGVGIVESGMGPAWVLLDKELRFAQTSLLTGVAFPLSYLPALWLALRGGGYWSLVVQNAVYYLLLLIGMWWTARRWLPHVWQLHWRFDRQTAIRLMRFGIMVGLAILAGMLVGQYDNFLVGTFVGLATLGFYDRAYRIAQWPSTLVSGIISRTALYTYARIQDDPERLQKAVSMVLWMTTTLALPLALAIFVSAPDLLTLLYGGRWLPSALFVRFLVMYSLLRPLLDNASSLFIAVGKPQRNTFFVISQALALILAGTPLTLAYGAVGTCIGVGVAFALGLLLSYPYLCRMVNISLWDVFGVPGLASIVVVLAYLTLTHAIDLNMLPLAVRVVAKAGFTTASFFAAMWIIQPGELMKRFKYVWRLLRSA